MDIITSNRGFIDEYKRYTLTEEDKHALSVVKEIFKKLGYDDFKLSCPLGYIFEVSDIMNRIEKHEGDYFYPDKHNEYFIF